MRLVSPKLIAVINQLSIEELRALNILIVTRLRELQRHEAHQGLHNFNVLDQVTFEHHGELKRGLITRLNQRTATVVLPTGQRWTVEPKFLRKVM